MAKKNAKPIKNRDPNRYADRFYDYIMARRGQMLRFLIAALVTALLQYLLNRLMPDSLIPFMARFFLFFAAARFWVYRQTELNIFDILRQLMLAFMAIVATALIANFMLALLVGLLGHPILFNYLCLLLLEIAYFLFFQFLIFKVKND